MFVQNVVKFYYSGMYFHFISCKVSVWTKDEQLKTVQIQLAPEICF